MKKKGGKIVIAVFLILGALAVLSGMSRAGGESSAEPVERKELVETYAGYAVEIPEGYEDIWDLLDEIPIKEKTVTEGQAVLSYETGSLGKYIPDCEELSAVEKVEGTVYVIYVTTAKEYVILTYDKGALTEKSIYDEEQDQAVFIKDGTAYVYENYYKSSMSRNMKSLLRL